MPQDPMAEAIIDKQSRANRRLYSSEDDEYYAKIYRERAHIKSYLLAPLKEDVEFRKQVKELLNREEK